MADEDRRPPPVGGIGQHPRDRPVRGAGIVDRDGLRVPRQRRAQPPLGEIVVVPAFHDLDGEAPRLPLERGDQPADPRLVRLEGEMVAEHQEMPAARHHAADQEGRRPAGGGIVDPRIGEPRRARDVRDHRHHRLAGGLGPADRRLDCGMGLGVEHDAVALRPVDMLGHQLGIVGLQPGALDDDRAVDPLRELGEFRAHALDQRQLRPRQQDLDPEHAPVARRQHPPEIERAGRRQHPLGHLDADIAPLVQDPVDGGGAHARLPRDVPERCALLRHGDARPPPRPLPRREATPAPPRGQ